MQWLKGCLVLALFCTLSVSATPQISVWLHCANGVHATIQNGELVAEGIIHLPFESVESETNDEMTLVFTDNSIKAKVLIQYAKAKFFLNDTDGSWTPCIARKIP